MPIHHPTKGAEKRTEMIDYWNMESNRSVTLGWGPTRRGGIECIIKSWWPALRISFINVIIIYFKDYIHYASAGLALGEVVERYHVILILKIIFKDYLFICVLLLQPNSQHNLNFKYIINLLFYIIFILLGWRVVISGWRPTKGKGGKESGGVVVGLPELLKDIEWKHRKYNPEVPLLY